MKIEFKKSANNTNQEYVLVNEIFEGKIFFDGNQSVFIFEPTIGQQMVLPKDYDEAHQELTRKFS